MKEEFIDRYKQFCPDFAIVEELPHYLRVNTLKISDKELVERLEERTVLIKKTFLKNCYEFVSPFTLSSSAEYLEGFFYFQDAASQVVAHALNPLPDSYVLDMCASPGGKTSHFAQFMNNTGVIVACESVFPRLSSLKNNIERMGVSNCVVFRKDARHVDDFGLEFDFVLLDAPCSGNYTQDRDWFEKRSLDSIKTINRDQKDMFRAAYKVLKKGGTMVYSTCSFEPEENELIVDWALEKYPDMKLVDAGINAGSPGITEVFGKKLNPEIKKCIRFWPHVTNTGGFFLAKLKKS